jgi:hypothetical protein
MSDDLNEYEDTEIENTETDDVEESGLESITPKNKATKWKKPPTVAELKQDYEDSKQSKDAHVTDVNRWLDNLYMTGSAKPPKIAGRSSVAPMLIRKQAEWRYASLSEPFLSTDDLFNTAPVTYEDKTAAIQNGLVLNSQFNSKINKIKFIDEYVRTAVNEGTVVVRVGWDFAEEEREIEVDDFQYVEDTSDENIKLLQDANEAFQADPNLFELNTPEEIKGALQQSITTGIPYKGIKIGSHKQKQVRTVKNQPTVDICDYRNISIDPSCLGDISKAKFIIHSFETSIAELEAEGKYYDLDKINIEGNTILGQPDHSSASNDTSFNFTDKARKKIVAHEYWGYRDVTGDNTLTAIVSTWVGDVLIRSEENPFPNQKLPFVVVPYLPVTRSIYGEPDGELLEDNQKIIGAVTRGMIDILGRSANGQMGIRKDALDVTNRRKFDKGMDYEFNPTVDPRQAFFMHTFPEIPQSAQILLQHQNADAESLTGVKAFSGGITGAGLGSSATSVRGALDAASKRELGILRRLAEGIKDIGRKIIEMNSEFLDDIEVVRITNESFVEVKKDDLQGNVDITLSISTIEADEHKAEELAFMLQTMGNNMDPALSKMILVDIARLRKMPDLAKSIENYQPQPDPIQQEKAALEIELLKAQIANEQAKANENNANGILDQAKAETEAAKARNLSSEADLKDLDFVETETGTKHERAINSIEAQARGNLALKNAESRNKITENLFNKRIGIGKD